MYRRQFLLALEDGFLGLVGCTEELAGWELWQDDRQLKL